MSQRAVIVCKSLVGLVRILMLSEWHNSQSPEPQTMLLPCFVKIHRAMGSKCYTISTCSSPAETK